MPIKHQYIYTWPELDRRWSPQAGTAEYYYYTYDYAVFTVLLRAAKWTDWYAAVQVLVTC
jgi:hypothetical protein